MLEEIPPITDTSPPAPLSSLPSTQTLGETHQDFVRNGVQCTPVRGDSGDVRIPGSSKGARALGLPMVPDGIAAISPRVVVMSPMSELPQQETAIVSPISTNIVNPLHYEQDIEELDNLPTSSVKDHIAQFNNLEPQATAVSRVGRKILPVKRYGFNN